jgi:hypothetical protein
MWMLEQRALKMCSELHADISTDMECFRPQLEASPFFTFRRPAARNNLQ